MRRIGVLTSGGDSPGMNAAVRAVVRCSLEQGLEIYGIYRGFEGLLDAELKEMERGDVGDILQNGGTILKTARSERFRTEEGMRRAINVLNTFEIDGLVVIGGDGSLHGGLDLSNHGIRVMGVPGTIDNDLGYTDFTIGFDTAVTTVLDAISKLRDTSSAHERVVIVEVMGRHCGDIALYAGLTGGAEEVLIPELPYDIKALSRRIIESANRGKQHHIIIKAEGVDISTAELAAQLQENTGRETKQVVLSYLQRGGSPTMRDRLLATLCAEKAVDLLAKDSTSKAIGEVNGRIVAVDLEDALKEKRALDHDLYELIGVLSK